jgi:hypothetical protein
MKKTRLLVFILAAALMISGIVGIGVSAAGETNTQVAVKSANLSFVNEPALVFAIEHDGRRDAVKLNVWDSEPEEDQAPDYVVESYFLQTIGGVEYTTFAVKGKNPKNVYDYVWVQPEADGVVGKVVRYSALQYALGGVFKGDEFADMYQSIIDYSAAAQKWTGYVDANGKTADEYVYVAVNDGTVGGYANSVYPAGTSVAPVYSGEGDYTHWQVVDSTGAELSVVAMGSEIELSQSVRLVPHKPLVDTTYVTDYEGGTLYSDYVKSYDNDGNLANSAYPASPGSGLTMGLATKGENSFLQVRNTANSGKIGKTVVNISNTLPDGNCYTFETKINVMGGNAGYNNAQIKFVNGNGGEALNLFLGMKTVDGKTGVSIAVTGDNASITKGTCVFDATDKTISTATWFTLRIEFYFGGVGTENAENTYMKVYVDDVLSFDGQANWAMGASITHAQIDHISAGKAHNTCYDDISFTRTNKAYVEGSDVSAE